MRAVRWVISLVVLALCAAYLSTLDWKMLTGYVSHARLSLIVVVTLIPLFHALLKSERWRILLTPFAAVPWLRLYYTLIISFAASAVLPARAGELLRLFVLKREYNVPVPSSIGVILVEKFLEMAGLLLVVGPLMFFLPLEEAWIKHTALGLAILVVVGVVALLVIARYAKSNTSFLGRLADGMRCIGTARRLVAVLSLSVAIFVVDGVMITLVMRAYGIDLHWAAPALVLLPVNIAIALPSTPAQIGIFEAAAVGGLTALGVQGERALAFAMTYHFVQILPQMVIAGLTGRQLLADTRQQLMDATQLDGDETAREDQARDPSRDQAPAQS